ncbi:MAG: hypothetical protein GY828_04765 [Candidatus Gracilibacteria bacterium]|nr:hypothetical protein [Candidatus Gracilibacteria bacterium]
MKRTIFIGDIHGCYDEFQLLLEKLKITQFDIIYLTGDMINKGPKSWKVIKYLYKHRDQFKAILGNNEFYFFQYYLEGNSLTITEDFIKLKEKFDKHPEIFKYFRKLPYYVDHSDFLLIHGGLDPSKTLEKHSNEEISTIRLINEKPWYEQYTGSKKVIYGHWATNGLNIVKNTIGIDGGCLYGKCLHAYVLESGEIYTQPALKLYRDVFIKDDKGEFQN